MNQSNVVKQQGVIKCSLCTREYENATPSQGHGCSVSVHDTFVCGHYGSVMFDMDNLLFIGERPEKFRIGTVVCDYCICIARRDGIVDYQDIERDECQYSFVCGCFSNQYMCEKKHRKSTNKLSWKCHSYSIR